MHFRHFHRHGGGGVTGADRVDVYFVRRPFAGERLGQLHYTGLGGVVGALVLRAVNDFRRHRCRVDDSSAFPSCDHGATCRAGHIEDCVEVHVDDTQPLLVAHFLGWPVHADPRIVEYDVEPAELAHHFCDQLINLRAVGDITFKRQGASSHGTNRIGNDGDLRTG